MLFKLGILIGILIIGGYVFSAQIQNLFPNTSTDGVNSLKSDVNTLTTKSIESAEDKIESSINQTQTKLVEIKDESSYYIKNKIPFLNFTG
jgi:hypothetical protein